MFINIPENNDAGVYAIKNIDNDKIYIGQTKNMRKRIKQHLIELENNNHISKEMQEDFNKGSNFSIDILFKAPKHIDTNILTKIESWYILNMKSCSSGYNSTYGPGSFSLEEAKRKSISPSQFEIIKNSKKGDYVICGGFKEVEAFAIKSIEDMLKNINWNMDDLYSYYCLHK